MPETMNKMVINNNARPHKSAIMVFNHQRVIDHASRLHKIAVRVFNHQQVIARPAATVFHNSDIFDPGTAR